MYKELVAPFAQKNEWIVPQKPAAHEQIETAEQAMKVAFPNELKQLLKEMNGDKYFCLSCEQIVEYNRIVREGLSEFYEGLYHLLFVAGNGCGDYYGYVIQSGLCIEGQIIMWEHETNETHIVAASLAEMISRYYSGEI